MKLTSSTAKKYYRTMLRIVTCTWTAIPKIETLLHFRLKSILATSSRKLQLCDHSLLLQGGVVYFRTVKALRLMAKMHNISHHIRDTT